MDRIVELIVRFISLVAGAAAVVPGIRYDEWKPGDKVKVLLAGYNGARNTGSDVRVASMARQIVGEFGADNVEVSVMTLDEQGTSAYFEGVARQVPFGTLFFKKLLQACSENHVIVLSEGSTLKSKFADALTLYACQAAGVARAQGKPCIAFGSEVGEMNPYLERAARDLCSDAYFVTRSAASDEERRRLGFRGHLGTDTAWDFDSSAAHGAAMGRLRAAGWDGRAPLLGIAPVNPFCWPVKPSLSKLVRAVVTGDRALNYQSWYFFSWSQERKEKFRAYVDALADAAATFCAERGFAPVIFGMEQLDREACELVAERMGGNVPTILSNDTDGFVISETLRSLSLLLTSRYHAQVLATGGLVPAVAVSMDERLDNLAAELGVGEELLLHVDDEDLAPKALVALDRAWDGRAAVVDVLAEAKCRVQATLREMDEWFGGYVRAQLGVPALPGALS